VISVDISHCIPGIIAEKYVRAKSREKPYSAVENHLAIVMTKKNGVMGATECLRIQFIPIRQHCDTETDKALRYRSLVHSEYYVQNYVQIGLRGAQNRPKIAYHCHSKLLIPNKAGRDFRFTNRLLKQSGGDATDCQTRQMQRQGFPKCFTMARWISSSASARARFSS
jgi:hypothetical protein